MPPIAAPEQLATRSDLPSDSRRPVADAINPWRRMRSLCT